MLPEPATFAIALGDRKAVACLFIKASRTEIIIVSMLALPRIIHPSFSTSEDRTLCLVMLLLQLLRLLQKGSRFISVFKSGVPYVTIERDGLSWALPEKRSLSWSRVVACACKNEEGRRILRLFLRDRRIGEYDVFGRAETVDIDFAPAAQPKQALDEATVASAAWVAATRDASIKESPLREFVEKRSRWNRWRLGLANP